MFIQRYVAIAHYRVLDALKEKKDVMCLDREQNTVFKLNTLNVDTVMDIITNAESYEKGIGYDYSTLSRYNFWYIRYDEVKEESEVTEEEQKDESVSDE